MNDKVTSITDVRFERAVRRCLAELKRLSSEDRDRLASAYQYSGVSELLHDTTNNTNVSLCETRSMFDKER